MEIFNKINHIRDLNKSIQNDEVEITNLQSAIDDLYPLELNNYSELDNELKEIYFNSILDLSTVINTKLLYISIPEKLLKSLLSIVEDSELKKNIYEKLLNLQTSENPFRSNEYVKEFNKKFADICSDLRRQYLSTILQSSFGVQKTSYDVVEEFETQLDVFFSQKNIRLISELRDQKTKIIIIQNLLNCLGEYYHFTYYGIKMTRKFEKEFFQKLLKINISDKTLDGILTDRFYGVIFDSKGVLKNIDKLKKKFFGGR